MTALIAIETCDSPKYEKRQKRILDTWGAQLNMLWDLKIFTGKILGCSDNYIDLPEKTRAICRFAAVKGYDGLLITDDDTAIRTNKLFRPPFDYAGHIIPSQREFGPPSFKKYGERYCSGGCYWLSRRALEIVAGSSLLPEYTFNEDEWVGKVLRDHNIYPVDLPEFQISGFGFDPNVRSYPGYETPPYDGVVFLTQVRTDKHFYGFLK